MTKNTFLKIIIITAVAGFFLIALPAGAAEFTFPEIGNTRAPSQESGFAAFIVYFYNLILAVTGFIAFGVIIYAGFRLMTAGGNVAAVKDAKDKITSAVLGLALVAGAYLILFTINPDLVRFKPLDFSGLVDRALDEAGVPSEEREDDNTNADAARQERLNREARQLAEQNPGIFDENQTCDFITETECADKGGMQPQAPVSTPSGPNSDDLETFCKAQAINAGDAPPDSRGENLIPCSFAK